MVPQVVYYVFFVFYHIRLNTMHFMVCLRQQVSKTSEITLLFAIVFDKKKKKRDSRFLK